MRMRDLHNEVMSYYQGVYGMYGGKLYMLDDITPPEGDEEDEYGDAHWSFDDGNLEVDTDLHRFTAYCREVKLTDGLRDHREPSEEISMDKFDFSFPTTGLVNVPVHMQSIEEQFNIVKYVSRSATRQWRRAMRRDSFSMTTIGGNILSHLVAVTDETPRELVTSRTNNAIHGLYFPHYFTADEVLSSLQHTVGTYAISKDWWIGQGSHGIIFGYRGDVCGSVDDEGLFSFSDESLGFLKESLTELIGDNCYAA